MAARVADEADLDESGEREAAPDRATLKRGIVRQTLDYCRYVLFQAPARGSGPPRQLALPWLGSVAYTEADLYCAMPSAPDRPPRSTRAVGRDRWGDVLIRDHASHDPTAAQAAMLPHWRVVFRREMRRTDHEPLQVEHLTVWRCYLALETYDGELVKATNRVRPPGEAAPTFRKMAETYGKSERQLKLDLGEACWALALGCYAAHRRAR